MPKNDAQKVTSKPPVVVRPSSERGHANHGWLDSYHTFSFAGFFDKNHESWGPLRVINEDKVKGGRGFGAHPHANYEIFSYILDGELKHGDSMGNEEIISRGDVQFTSAGKGIFHSEFNASKENPVTFLQIWVKPSKLNLKPSYKTARFSDEDKKNQLALIVSKDGRKNSIQIHQQCDVYASILEPEQEVTFELPEGRLGYLHLTLTGGRLALNEEIKLDQGDGAYLTGPVQLKIRSTGKRPAEFVLFDLPDDAGVEDDDY